MPGIDQQIEQRKMQFGNNPQALQQRYGQSKQLLDLLALQQIAQEQQQKAQAMQMQMQQNPATIAQQVEQEVIQGKKAEMAQSISGLQAMRAPKRSQSETARGVAGALAQKQREQQSRMQNLAKQGVASQPARNMERMYDGGIVGYKAGGITQADIDEARKNPAYRGYSDEQIRDMLERQAAFKDIPTMGEAYRMKLGVEEKAQEREEARAQKDREDIRRGITLQPEETRMAVPGAELEESLIPADMQRQLEGRRSLEAPEFQAFLEEAAGGYDRAPQQAEPEMSMENILAAVKGPAGAQPQAPAAVEAQPEQKSIFRPQDLEFLNAQGSTAAPAAPAEPSMQEQLLKQLMASSQQEQKDITSAREALEAQYGGRSKGRKFLDLFKRAAQAQAQGPLRTTNRAALAGLLGGMATAEGEEKETYKKGLESIAERQRALTQGQLGVATGLAGIKRGEEMTEVERRRVAEQETAGAAGRQLSIRQFEENKKQFSETLAQRANETEQNLRMRAAELAQSGRLSQAAQKADEEYRKAVLRIQNAELDLKKKGDPKDYLNALVAYQQSIDKYIGTLLDTTVDQEERAEIIRLRDQLVSDRARMVRGMAGAEGVSIPEIMEERGSAATDTEGFSIRSVR